MKPTKTTPKEAAKGVVHILLITAAATAGTIGLMAFPLDCDSMWFEKLILSKVIAVGGWYVAWRLYNRWRNTDKWLAAFDKSCDEALEAPNPMCIDKEGEKE